MPDPFLSEIRLMSFNFTPVAWRACDGALLPINQNQALFSLLGTRYGGNGQTTFALPDLRDRVPIHTGPGYDLGQVGGWASHTVVASELPTHQHAVAASSATQGGSQSPANRYLGGGGNAYHPPSAALRAMRAESVENIGSSQAHENRQPFLTLMYCIAVIGIFPSRPSGGS
jgi:microcystin-dependent protein